MRRRDGPKRRKPPHKPNVFTRTPDWKATQKEPKRQSVIPMPLTERERLALPREKFLMAMKTLRDQKGIDAVLLYARERVRFVQMLGRDREAFEVACNRIAELSERPELKAALHRSILTFWVILNQYA